MTDPAKPDAASSAQPDPAPVVNVIRLCSGDECGLRFPAPSDDRRVEECPLCGASTEVLRQIAAGLTPDSATPHRSVVGVLDNLRSAANTGTIIRTADGAGIEHMHLCGFTPTPENRKVLKTSLDSERSIDWSHSFNSLDVADLVKSEGFELWVLEATPDSTPLFDAPGPDEVPRVAFVVGNEVAGVDPGLIERADRVVHLPMQGIKMSLNVSVAFGVAAYWLAFGQVPESGSSAPHGDG